MEIILMCDAPGSLNPRITSSSLYGGPPSPLPVLCSSTRQSKLKSLWPVNPHLLVLNIKPGLPDSSAGRARHVLYVPNTCGGQGETCRLCTQYLWQAGWDMSSMYLIPVAGRVRHVVYVPNTCGGQGETCPLCAQYLWRAGWDMSSMYQIPVAGRVRHVLYVPNTCGRQGETCPLCTQYL